ncbi:MAG: tetratricopeptide repeat protein [Verrucomicrobiota bacterium]
MHPLVATFKRFRWLSFAALSVAALVSFGCATYVRDTAWTPAVYSFGPANRFLLAELRGKAVHRDRFQDALRHQVRKSDWWQFEDRRQAGDRLAQPKMGEICVQILIYEINVDETYEPKVKAENGQESAAVNITSGWKGLVSFAATVRGHRENSVMHDREYTARGEAENTEGAEDRLKEKLLQEAIQDFLEDITPREKTRLLRIDDEREDMKPIAELIRDRNYHSALETLQEMLQLHPQRPDLLYNIGTVLQGMGQYAEALDYYNQAIRSGPKDYYRETRQRCVDRLNAVEELEP